MTLGGIVQLGNNLTMTANGTLDLAATSTLQTDAGTPVITLYDGTGTAGIGIFDVDVGTEIAGGENLTVAGTTDVAAGITLTVTHTGVVLLTGSVTIPNTSFITLSSAGEIEFDSALVLAGTLQTTNAGTLDFDGDVSGDAAGTRTITLHATTNAVTFAADLNLTNLTFTHNDVDIIFDGTSELTSAANIFPGVTVNSSLTLLDNLTLGAGENLTADGTVTVGTHTLTVPSGTTTINGTLTASTGTCNFDGPVNIGATGELEMTGAGIVQLGDNLTMTANGTLDLAATSTLQTNTGTPMITLNDGTGTASIGIFDVDVGTTIAGGENLTVAGTTDVAAGITLTVTHTGVVLLTGSVTIPDTSGITLTNSGEIEFDSAFTGANTLNGTIQCTNADGTLDFDAAVTIGAAPANLDANVACTVEFAGNLTDTDTGTVTLTNANVVVDGTSVFDILGMTIGSLNVNGGDLTYNSTAASQTLTVTGNTSVNSSLVIAGDDSMVFNGAFTLGSDDTVIVQDTATATFGDATGDTITFNGSVSCSSTATPALTFNGETEIPGSLTVTGTGNVTSSASMTNAGGTIQIDSTLTFSGVTGTANFGGGTTTLNNLTIDTGAGTVKLSGNASIDTTVNGTLTLTSGTLDGGNAPGPTLILAKAGTGAAAPFQSAGTFNGNGGTVKYTGSAETDITPFTGAGTSYNNLTIDSTGAASTLFNLSATTSLTGNLWVINGVLVLGAGDTLNVAGTSTFETNGTLDIDGTGDFTGLVTYKKHLTNNGNFVIGTGGASITGNFTNNAPLVLNASVTVSGTVYNNGTMTAAAGGSLQADTVINASADTLVVDGVTFPIVTNKFINNLRAKVHINGTLGGTLTFAPPSGGTSVQINNAGIINIGASASPGTAGNGTLQPATSSDVVHLLNTGVINMGSSAHIGSLGTANEPLASLNNHAPEGAPVTGTGTINVSQAVGADNAIFVQGDWKSSGTFITGDAAVTLSGSGVLEHTSINGFSSLTISGGTRTLGSNLVVNGTFDIPVSVNFNAGSNDIYVGGTATISGRMTATGGTQTYGAGLTVSGICDNGTNDVTVNINGSFTNSGTVILGSGFVIAQSVTNTGQLTSTSGSLSVSGNFDNDNVFNHNGGTVILTDAGNFDPTPSDFNNIIKRGLGTTTTLTENLTMVGALTVESGTFIANNFNITVSGNVSVAGNTLTFVAGDLILNPPANTTQTFDPGTLSSTYNDVIKRGAGVSQLINNPIVLTDAGGDTGDLGVEAGTFEMGSQNVTIPGILTISDTATLTDGTGTLSVTGTTTIEGTLSASDAATHRFTALSVNVDGIYDNGTNAVTVNATSTVTNNGTVTLGSGVVDFVAGVTNNNTFTSTSGELKIVGNLSNTGAFKHNGGTVIFGGNSTFTPGLSAYNHITKTGAGTTTTLGGALTSVEMLEVDSGTMALSTYDVEVGQLTIAGDAEITQAANSSLNVSGDFTNNGQFTHAASNILSLTGTCTFAPGTSNYAGTLLTSGIITLATDSTLNFAGATWTNTGTFNAGAGSTVKFNRSGDQTLTTGGTPAVPAMSFVNIETDNDDTITFVTAVNLSGTFTIAGGATVCDVTPGSVYTFAQGAEVNVSGTWMLTGSAASHIQLLGPVTPDADGDGIPDVDLTQRWTLTVNSAGTVNLNYIDLLSSDLVTHGGSINGKNVGYVVESFGNLSASWGPFDPIPIPANLEPTVPTEPAEDVPVKLAGDANDDDVVNLADFSILASVFGTADARADFNGDGFVTLADFSILAANFGKSLGDLPAAPVAKAALPYFTGSLDLHVPAKVRRGDVVEVDVIAEDASLKAYSFALGYDASMLELLEGGITEGEFLKDTLFVAQDGRVFSATRSGASEGNGILTKLRFRVIADGTSDDAIALRDVQVVDGTGSFSRLPELKSRFASPLRSEHVALSTIPHKTRLLANYPNPFNPETWIPFELADDANVKLQIYDVSGHLVRTLDLGYRPAGRYVDRSAAVHWDGRNFSGERVASGVYLYRLTAKGQPHGVAATAIRRMLILK